MGMRVFDAAWPLAGSGWLTAVGAPPTAAATRRNDKGLVAPRRPIWHAVGGRDEVRRGDGGGGGGGGAAGGER